MRNESPTPQAANESAGDFLHCVLVGLRRRPKSIPPKFFYDARGSHLFDLICATPEYYPTRTETAILERYGAQMAARIVKELGRDGFGLAAQTDQHAMQKIPSGFVRGLRGG